MATSHTAGSKRARDDSTPQPEDLSCIIETIVSFVRSIIGDKSNKYYLKVIKTLLNESENETESENESENETESDCDLDFVVSELSKCNVGGTEGSNLTDLLARLRVSEPNDPNDPPVKRQCTQ